MRAVFFLLAAGLFSCSHTGPAPREAKLSEEAPREGALPLEVQKRVALWKALLAELDARLEAGQVEADELRWLQASLEYAWSTQEKAGFPEALSEQAKSFLERLDATLLSPAEAEEIGIWPVWPVELSSPYGWRLHPLTGERRFHQGVDLKTMAREEVRSIQAGWVLHAGWAGGYGHMVEVLHAGGSFSRYAHLSQVKVRLGEEIRRGDVLGLAGDSGLATGVHLHFELWKEGHPVDPTQHLPWARTLWP